MYRSFLRSTVVRAGLALGAAGFSACSAGYTTDNSSPVLFTVALVNGGTALKSDVLKDSSVFTDFVNVDLAVRFKNPNVATVPSIPNAVQVTGYKIVYRRSDGRGVEGQDVPYTISGNVSAILDVKTSGVDALSLEVVRAQAKLEPPLRNLENGGGAIVVTMFADITIYGRTISGIQVQGTGSLQIDFADWADK